jgi:hypothetical protein
VSGVQRGDLDRQAKGLEGVVEGDQAVDTVVAVTVSYGDKQRQLAAMEEAVGSEFVETVTIDPALAVAVPAPESQRVTIGTLAGAAFLWFFAPISNGQRHFEHLRTIAESSFNPQMWAKPLENPL